MYYDDYIKLGYFPPANYAELGKEYVAISPSGEIIKFRNVRQFIRDNPELKFSFKNISACTKGEKGTHRGWKFYQAEDYKSVT